MRRDGRSAKQDFTPGEHLYYRLEQSYPIGSVPSGVSLRRPEFSVNRQRHGGKAEYVLIPSWLDHGIAEFEVRGIPKVLTSSGGVEYNWVAYHDPLDENYHHSEVRTYKGTTRLQRGSQVNDLVYREFRQRLSESMIVIKVYSGDDL